MHYSLMYSAVHEFNWEFLSVMYAFVFAEMGQLLTLFLYSLHLVKELSQILQYLNTKYWFLTIIDASTFK